jgi:hypothetical protein
MESPRYLWELDLAQVPLGWEKTYNEALEECPTGTYITIPDYDASVSGETRCWYNPVKYHQTLLETFNRLKQKALSIISKEQDTPLHKIDDLIKIDICLYAILDLWLDDDNFFDGSSFDPNSLGDIKTIMKYDFYFDWDHNNTHNKYEGLRLVHLSA